MSSEKKEKNAQQDVLMVDYLTIAKHSNAPDTDLAKFNQIMKEEKERLKTFKDWPVTCVKPEELAKYGFYYMGYKDQVKCAFCKLCIFKWQEGDSPFAEHLKHYSSCPFLRGYNVGNVPISESPIKLTGLERGVDTCGHFTHSIVRTSNSSSSDDKPNDLNLNLVNIVSCSGPKNTDFVTLDSRLRSFEKCWPKQSLVKPNKLAEAGFFYIGIEDYVKCFYCDGGLCQWEADDEPWTEHEKWFPLCDFIRLMKSENTSKPIAASQEEKVMTVQATEVNSKTSENVNKEITKKQNNPDSNETNTNSNIEKSNSSSKETNATSELNVEIHEEATVEANVEANTEVEVQVKVNTNPNVETKEDVNIEANEEANESVNSQSSDEDSAIASGTSSPNEISPQPSPKPPSSKPSHSHGPICKICLDLDVNVVLIPCMHAISCVQCALGLNKCPICRSVIMERKRLFFS